MFKLLVESQYSRWDASLPLLYKTATRYIRLEIVSIGVPVTIYVRSCQDPALSSARNTSLANSVYLRRYVRSQEEEESALKSQFV
jgi:hypothetical protein